MNFASDRDVPAGSSMFSSHTGGMDGPGPSPTLSGSSSDMNPQDAVELQEFLALEQGKAQMRAQIQTMTDLCWEKCMGQPSSKLESKTETCMDNCAQRFVDVSLLVTNRFATLLQRQANM